MNHVTLQAAKALQSVGFDLPTHYFYPHNPEKVLGHHDTRFYKEGEVLYSKDPYLFDGLAAPDTLEAVLWLWDRHKVWCVVHLTASGKFSDMCYDHRKGVCDVSYVPKITPRADDPLTAYSSAILAACEWAKTKKA